MTRRVSNQLVLTPARIDHQHARELDTISDALNGVSGLTELVELDICAGASAGKGRPGLSADQVLRITVLKQLNGFSYAQLEFHLADSSSYRRFCMLSLGEAPRRSTLQENVKRLRPETLEAINQRVIEYARAREVERGQTVRVDSTVVKADIHAPYDSWLLRDTVRVLAALMRKAEKNYDLIFQDHTRVAKRRDLTIHNARSSEARIRPYRDLIKVTRKTISDARRIRRDLRRRTDDSKRSRQARRIAARLEHFIELGERVVDQTERRVLRGEQVPAAEKVVSIFEPHADIVVKQRRETVYGHKITIVTGKSGLVTAATIHDGNPADSTLAWPMIEKHEAVFRAVPAEAAFDGGFTSRENLDKLKAEGVKSVAFTKSAGLTVEEMVEDQRAFRRLRNFRAGVEGNISHLKRVFGLGRCNWNGRGSFHTYVRASILTANLLVLARHLLG